MTTHIERTASAPRQSRLHPVKLSNIQRATPTVRLLTLSLPYAIKKSCVYRPALSLSLSQRDTDQAVQDKFLPGQWVDLHIPSLRSPGGFTITSPPSSAGAESSTGDLSKLPAGAELSGSPPLSSLPSSRPFIELAVQRTSNPPAQWLWQPTEEILGSALNIRIGGSFTWPPPGVDVSQVERLVFVAGGVGINPFMSMLSSMYEIPQNLPQNISFLYSIKKPVRLQDTLFSERLRHLFDAQKSKSKNRYLEVHVTGNEGPSVEAFGQESSSDTFRIRKGRISEADLAEATNGFEKDQPGRTVAYVCGPGEFVDNIVKQMSEKLGKNQVFYERWW